MNISGIDTQDAAEIGEFEGIFSTFRVLFEVPGQAAVAVCHRAEGGLDTPAQRERGEAIRLRVTCGNLKIDLVLVCGGSHRGTHIDPVDLDSIKIKSALDGPIQEKFGRLGVVDIGRRDQDRQNEAERTGQDMTLDALDFLVAVEATLTLLGAGDNALRIHDPGRRLRLMAMGFAYPPRQLSGGIRPDALGPEPVIPGAHRLVRAEVGRQRPPWAARMLQVETARVLRAEWQPI